MTDALKVGDRVYVNHGILKGQVGCIRGVDIIANNLILYDVVMDDATLPSILSYWNCYIEKLPEEENEMKEQTELKLEVGKKYEDKEGNISLVIADLRKFGINNNYPFLVLDLSTVNEPPFIFNENGEFSDANSPEYNLIKEHREPIKNSCEGYAVYYPYRKPSDNWIDQLLGLNVYCIYKTEEDAKECSLIHDLKFKKFRFTAEEIVEDKK